MERRYWEAWERSREDKVTRIEAYGSPGAQCGTTLDHDTELRATYRWEKTETQAGKPSFLEGVLKCIDKRRKLMELGRRKEEKTGREGSRAANVVAHGPSSLGGEESEAALHSMHCVISTVSDWTGAGTQCSVLSTGIHRVTAPANESPTPPSGTRERTASESCRPHCTLCIALRTFRPPARLTLDAIASTERASGTLTRRRATRGAARKAMRALQPMHCVKRPCPPVSRQNTLLVPSTPGVCSNRVPESPHGLRNTCRGTRNGCVPFLFRRTSLLRPEDGRRFSQPGTPWGNVPTVLGNSGQRPNPFQGERLARSSVLALPFPRGIADSLYYTSRVRPRPACPAGERGCGRLPPKRSALQTPSGLSGR